MPTSDSSRLEQTRGALTGAMISGIFGIAWAQWGASGLSGTISAATRFLAIAVGITIVVRSARLRGSAPAESTSIFTSRAYLLVVLGEVVTLVAGAELLSAVGEAAYVPAWFATVVGTHFVVFGRLFHASFYWLGGVILIGGVAGAVVGAGGGGQAGIEATSGLVVAVSMLAAGGWQVRGSNNLQRRTVRRGP